LHYDTATPPAAHTCFLLLLIYCSVTSLVSSSRFFFFLTDTPTTEIYTLSLHDALPICMTLGRRLTAEGIGTALLLAAVVGSSAVDRKSTRLTPVTRSSRMPSSA